MIAESEVEVEIPRSGERLDRAALEQWRGELQLDAPQDLLRRTFERFGSRAALVTSFQAEGLVLLDMVRRLLPHIEPRVITLDTGRLPQETHDLMARVTERYGITVEVVLPDPEKVANLVRRGGPNLFYNSPEERKACCHVRKVEPLERALSGLDAWVTGLRRGQSADRASIEPLALDSEHGGLLKLNPLAAWTWEEVWGYIDRNEVPYHSFYDRGYQSIGCAPCTRAVRPGADSRSGRWWWEDSVQKECGLHLVMPTTSASSTSTPTRKEVRA